MTITTRTRNAAYAMFYNSPREHEAPAMAQLFLLEADGTRTAVDFARPVPRPDITDVHVSAELLRVEPGTRLQVEVTVHRHVFQVIDVRAENLDVVSGATAHELPVGSVIQSVTNRSRAGQHRRTADGWHCVGAPAVAHPSWHKVATSDDLEYRIIERA